MITTKGKLNEKRVKMKEFYKNMLIDNQQLILALVRIRMNRIRIEIFCVLLFFVSCASTQNLTKNQIIEIAEKYVIEQGYAEKKINLKKTEIDPDILDQYQTLEKIAELRHNLLNPKAVFSKKIESGWSIGFEYKNEKFNKIENGIRFGKGLWISENGKEIRMFHENIGFK